MTAVILYQIKALYLTRTLRSRKKQTLHSSNRQYGFSVFSAAVCKKTGKLGLQSQAEKLTGTQGPTQTVTAQQAL
ncbi:hypothetical protein DDR33_15855 [Pararcticibacter amylolyticus]|uniref:Uncharacterized protein n=1 Tax=Pararcticibacter amylolyticus TaxID=2173175 RepID=A0A2U2PE10_9SPHI|nr:hypothetical protein DDR33_15855 [Pararcticibacter amylolyticus]